MDRYGAEIFGSGVYRRVVVPAGEGGPRGEPVFLTVEPCAGGYVFILSSEAGKTVLPAWWTSRDGAIENAVTMDKQFLLAAAAEGGIL